MKRLSYPITNVTHLREEREFFLRCRAGMSHAVTFANQRYIYSVIDSKIAFNAALIAQAERDALGHLATSGSYLT
jgi:hypothetical protein